MMNWIRSWWITDRIRYTPGQYQLLRLVSGNRVLVRERLWHVIEKSVESSNPEDNNSVDSDSDVTIVYQLLEVDEPIPIRASLQVVFRKSGKGDPTVSWNCIDSYVELFLDEVVIL